ncbi:phosphatase PAP2 family protein [Psychromicrobium lacuslunae]|uniref:phosphatase PAP2 family protein n=1 Tax=Psychromicrobium lacuslunae TaxID=1618207 RepID=UPI000696CF40|nr:phosphatase PAP2 family protein [Psychromicrobium lacuslunae]
MASQAEQIEPVEPVEPVKTAHPRLLRLPLPKHWLSSAIFLLLLVLAIGLSVKYLPGITTAELGIDQQLSRMHTAPLDAFARVLEFVFGPLFGPVLVLLIGLGVWLVRRRALDGLAFMLLACSGWVFSEVFKLIIARQRPDQSLLFDPLSPETGSNSFPSGHTCFAVALALAFYFLLPPGKWRGLVTILGSLTAIAVAWSRLYIGVHYLSDVIASFAASLAGVLLFAALWNRMGTAIEARQRQ